MSDYHSFEIIDTAGTDDRKILMDGVQLKCVKDYRVSVAHSAPGWIAKPDVEVTITFHVQDLALKINPEPFPR